VIDLLMLYNCSVSTAEIVVDGIKEEDEQE
jgi:hypothetical protein